MPERPNILLILTDQHHARAMGCAGNRQLKTPNLDRLAAEGVRFTSAFAASAHCGPSRLSILTGMYEHTHRRHGNHTEPAAWLDSLTMPASMKSRGYLSAFIVKGHLGVEWPRKQFDHGRYSFMSDALPGERLSCDYYRYLDENGWADKFDDIDPHLHLAAFCRGEKTACHTALIPLEHSVEKWCADETIKFLRRRDPATPFLAIMSFDRPHNPLSVPAPWDRMYDPDSVVLPANVTDDFRGKSKRHREALCGRVSYPYHPTSPGELRKCLAHYYGLVSLIDHQVGRVLEEMENLGILDQTVVIFTADHGDFAGEHGFLFKNLGLYDAVHRVPLIMRYPTALPRGLVFDGFVEHVDIFPSLAGFAGAEPPRTIEGRSFIEHLARGESDWTKQAVLCEHVTGGYHHVSLRNRRYRLNYDLTGEAGTALYELYDYERDPGELINLWNDPASRDLRESLFCDLLRFRSSPPMMHGASPPGWNPTHCFHGARNLENLSDESYRRDWGGGK